MSRETGDYQWVKGRQNSRLGNSGGRRDECPGGFVPGSWRGSEGGQNIKVLCLSGMGQAEFESRVGSDLAGYRCMKR